MDTTCCESAILEPTGIERLTAAGLSLDSSTLCMNELDFSKGIKKADESALNHIF